MNLEENNNFFRESFKGFNKDDVAAFIAKLSKDYSENEEKYKEHIAKLTADNKTKADELNKLYLDRENYSQNTDSLISSEELEDIEKKYKEDLDKLAADVREKDDMINSLMQSLKDVSASEKKYREEMNKLIDEVNEKNDIIENLKQAVAAANANSQNILPAVSSVSSVSSISAEEIDALKEKYTEVLRINEELKYKIEENERKLRDAGNISPDMVNQLSAQLSISESEKLFLLGLLKKITVSLGINANLENASKVSHIPENVIKEIEDKIDILARFKEKSVQLEIERENLIAERNDLKDRVEKYKVSAPNEQKMYEAVTAELGGIVYSAKKSAEDIVTRAKGEAEDIIARANMKRLSLLEENEKNIAEFKEKYQLIKREHLNVVAKYKEMSDRYSLRLAEVEEAIENISNSI
ncbi:MAG: hypothetical protein FWD71_13175 [Oscillospiraceae bacterium]|nr:hypothetical protein [Oscillospiraceae bacterium]